MSSQSHAWTKDRVASTNRSAVWTDVVNESMIEEPLQGIDPPRHAFETNIPVQRPAVVAKTGNSPSEGRIRGNSFVVERGVESGASTDAFPRLAQLWRFL